MLRDLDESKVLAWTGFLKKYTKAFYDKICLNEEYKNIVKYDESQFDEILKKYGTYRETLRNFIKKDTNGRGLIDRHKILSGILLAATDKEHLIFKVDDEAIKNSAIKEFPYWVIFPNEFYLHIILLRIMTEFNLKSKKCKMLSLSESYNIRFPDKMILWEEKKSLSYAEQFCKLLSLLIQEDDFSVKCLLLAHHLMFFYELAYDCAVEGLSNIYYNKVLK